MMLSDRQWSRICDLLPGKPGDVGRPPTQDNRTTLEGILWIARTGAPWRDLPAEFGKWNTVYMRFHVIPARVNRNNPAWHDQNVYRVRHFVENRFAVLKEFRGIATRYCKLAATYRANLYLVAVVTAMREQEHGRNPGGWPAVNRRLPV